jgi:biotin carboxylase
MRLLLFLPTSTYSASAFVEAAHQLEVEVVVASDRRQALEAVVPGRTLGLDFFAPQRAVKQIAEFAREWPLQAVVGTDDHTALLAALAAQALSLPHNPPEGVRAAGDKHLMRRILASAAVPSPDYTLVSLEDEPQNISAQVKYPCVLKPTFLAASRGVIRADNPGQFTAAFERIKTLLSRHEIIRRNKEAARLLLIEDYIPGSEVALEGLLTGGQLKLLALFDKPDPLKGPFFEETLYITPSRLPANTQEKIAQRTQEAARALGLREGPLHAELRFNQEEIWIVELAARQIGGLCSRILRFGAGISLEELILRHAVGQPLDKLERRAEPAGVMMLPVPRKGVLRQVHGLDAARLVPYIEDAVITIPPNQEVEPLPEGDRYLGFIFARAPSPEQVEKALRQAAKQLDVEFNCASS